MEQIPQKKTFNEEYRDNLATKIKQLRAEGKNEEASKLLNHEKEGAFYGDAEKTHREGKQMETRFNSKLEKLKAMAEKLGYTINVEDVNKVESTEEIAFNEQLQRTLAVAENLDKKIIVNKERSEETFGEENDDIAATTEAFEETEEKVISDVETMLKEKDSTYTEQDEENDKNWETIRVPIENKAEEKTEYEVDESGQIKRPEHKEDKKEEKAVDGIEEAAKQEVKPFSEWEDDQLKDAYKNNKTLMEAFGENTSEGMNLEDEKMRKALIERGLIEDDKEIIPEKEENTEQEKTARIAALVAIIAGAERTLNSKMAASMTDGMIMTEKLNIKRAKRELAKLEGTENKESKKTAATAIITLEKRNKDQKEKNQKGTGWFKRNWKKAVLGAGLLAALAFGPKSCESAIGKDDQDDDIEYLTPTNVSENVCIDAGDGVTQILEKALQNNSEMRDLSDFPLVSLTPETFKDLGEKIHVIDRHGNEIRLSSDFIDGEADVSYNKDNGFTIVLNDSAAETLDVRHQGEIGVSKHGPTLTEYATNKDGKSITNNVEKTISWEDAQKL